MDVLRSANLIMIVDKEERSMGILRSANLVMIVGMVALFAVGVLTSPSYAAIDPGTCVGLWLFDEGEGNTVEDSSGNGNDGTLVGGPTWVAGKIGGALEFDAVDDYVNCGNDASLRPEQVTVTAWFNPRTVVHGFIFANGKVWSDMAGVLVKVNGSLFIAGGVAQEPGNVAVWLNGPVINADRWYHTALTFDGTEVIIYLDGEEVARKAAAAIFYDDDISTIGAASNGFEWLFDGSIDEVALFNEALTGEDIKTIMVAGLENASVSPAGKLATTWSTIKGQ